MLPSIYVYLSDQSASQVVKTAPSCQLLQCYLQTRVARYQAQSHENAEGWSLWHFMSQLS